MFEWFKKNNIGRKIQAAVEDMVNGDTWAPFEGLEKGEALVRVTLAKGEVIRFEKIVPTKPRDIRAELKQAAEESGIFEGPVSVTVEKVPEPVLDRVDEEPSVKEKPRRRRG